MLLSNSEGGSIIFKFKMTLTALLGVAYVDKKAGTFNLIRINPDAPSMNKAPTGLPSALLNK